MFLIENEKKERKNVLRKKIPKEGELGEVGDEVWKFQEHYLNYTD